MAYTPLTNEAITAIALNERFADIDADIDGVADGNSGLKIAVLKDVKATTTDGGGATSDTWHTRTLNTETDPNSIVTLTANQFTPIAGNYGILAMAPAYSVDGHKLRLWNDTQSSTAWLGLNAHADVSQTLAMLLGYFTADGADAYELQHYTALTDADDGLGRAVDDGDDEIYAVVMLVKLP